MPYSTLLAETLGAVAAAVAVSWVIRLTLTAGAAIVVSVVVSGLAIPLLWSGVDDAQHWRQLLRTPPGVSPRLRCLVEAGDPPGLSALPVMLWLQHTMPATATYLLDSPTDHGCVALGLLPRVPAGRGMQPEFIIYWGTIPRVILARARWERDHSAAPRTVQLFSQSIALVSVGYS
jgi:hypothetical protein